MKKWEKVEAYTTEIKRRAAEQAAVWAERKATAQQHALEAKLACEALLADSLTGQPLTPAQRAEAADRVNRRYSLRGTPWSW